LVTHSNGASLTLPPSYPLHDTPSPHGSPLSLHDALPISPQNRCERTRPPPPGVAMPFFPATHATEHKSLIEWVAGKNGMATPGGDRKSTRLNSSHGSISYAVFCLKKKNKEQAQKVRPQLT